MKREVMPAQMRDCYLVLVGLVLTAGLIGSGIAAADWLYPARVAKVESVAPGLDLDTDVAIDPTYMTPLGQPQFRDLAIVDGKEFLTVTVDGTVTLGGASSWTTITLGNGDTITYRAQP